MDDEDPLADVPLEDPKGKAPEAPVGAAKVDEEAEEHTFIPLGEYPGPEAAPAPGSTSSSTSSPPAAAGAAATVGRTRGIDSVFEFHDVSKVSKVHQSTLKLDYWSYEVSAETNYEAYRRPRHATDLVTVTTHRRYREFEWLRDALAAEYPFNIVPPLPGFALEGMLEKVDNVLGTSEATSEVPALVTYRMRGLSLFLKWIARCPAFRTSTLLQCFLEHSNDEFAAFQESCKKPVVPTGTAHTMFGSVWGSLTRTLRGPPKAMNQNVIKARTNLTHLETALLQLKDQLEKLWDQIVNLCEGYTVERLDQQSLQRADDVLQALAKTSVIVKRAAHSFSVENEELFLSLVIELSFLSGLCTAGKGVVATMERLAHDVESLQAVAKSIPEATELQHYLDAGYDTFLDDYRRFHQLKRPAMKKLVRNFALLGTNMDPKNFAWEKYCTPVIHSVADVDW